MLLWLSLVGLGMQICPTDRWVEQGPTGMKTRQILRRWLILLPVTLVLCSPWILQADRAKAHNNPGFREVLLITVDVNDQPLSENIFQTYSEAFSLDLPKKTIELIWKITDDGGEKVVFAVAQGEKLHAEGLISGANSRVLRGGDIRIVNVEGASAPFRLEIYANVIDRSNKADS